MKTKELEQIQSLPQVRGGHVVDYKQGEHNAIVIGGRGVSGADEEEYKMCLNLNVYDMKFTNFAPLENARNEAGSFRINGFLYVFSGTLLDKTLAKTVKRHNI